MRALALIAALLAAGPALAASEIVIHEPWVGDYASPRGKPIAHCWDYRVAAPLGARC